MVAKYEMHKISKSLVKILGMSCAKGTYFTERGFLLLTSLDLVHLWYSGQAGLFNSFNVEAVGEKQTAPVSLATGLA